MKLTPVLLTAAVRTYAVAGQQNYCPHLFTIKLDFQKMKGSDTNSGVNPSTENL